MKKILYCDIDNTVNRQAESIRRFTKPSWPGPKIDQKVFTREEVLKYGMKPMAKGAIELLSQEYDINFLSARGFRDALQITKDELRSYGILWNAIYVVPNFTKKISFLRGTKCDLYIDDFTGGHNKLIPTFYKDYVAMIESFGIKVEVFMDNWAEIVERNIESHIISQDAP